MKKRLKWYTLVITVFMMLVVNGIFSLAVSAEDTVSIDVTVQYGQTEARSMLAMINGFRTGSDAWQWNSDNTTKTVYSAANGNALSPLTYDYNLERAAMLRATEIAIYYSHTRPNGTRCFTAYSGYMAMGENIAAGYRTAEAVFTGWQETDDDYSGQGHRRNMLDPGYTAVGIGHVYYNGYHYWVQEFGNPVQDTTVTAADDSSTTVAVEILPSEITRSVVNQGKEEMTIEYGAAAELPDITVGIQTAESWPSDRYCPITVPYEWKSADSSCASVANGRVTGNKCGTTKITAEVLGDTVAMSLTVEPASIDAASATLDASSYTYDGTAKTPSVTGVNLNGKMLQSGTDYTVAYANNTNAGTATVTITGKGNYTGKVEKTFTIQAANIGGCTLSNVVAQTFTGTQIKPQISATYAAKTLAAGTDYTVSYTNNVNAGTASITLTGKGNYTGTVSKSFTINQANLANCTVGNISAQTYTGAALTPALSLTLNGKELISGTDYTVSYTNNTSVGNASAVLTGKGNYTGSITKSFVINPRDLSSCTISDIAAVTYTGAAINPGITVKYGTKSLVSGTDYTVAYANNTNAGTATVTITGKGNYTGKAAKNFTIAAIDFGGASISVIADQTYTGTAFTPQVKVTFASRELKSGTDYKVSYSDNINAGTAKVTITGINNYKGSVLGEFKINPFSLDKCTVNEIGSQTYTGSAIIPNVTVVHGSRTLVQGTDYTVGASDNVNVGTATATITGKGNYTGSVTKQFAIVKPAPAATPGTPGSSNPGGSQDASGASKLTPGVSVEDSRTKASYRITASGSSQMPTVEYVKPLNAKASSVIIPDTVTINNVTCKVTSIAAKAFQNNKKLKKVKIGKNITTIGTKAFYGCTKLTSVTMGANVTDINACAFAKCTSLTKITIPGKVTKIGKQAFYGCKKLKKITIKTKKLTSGTVGSKAFKGIYSKATIKVQKSKLKAYKKVLKAKGIGSKVKVAK